MKTLSKVVAGSLFLLVGFNANANVVPTQLDKNWVCTTNASTSDVASDKQADDKMAHMHGSVKDAFSFAAKHCRDCTKISCEASK